MSNLQDIPLADPEGLPETGSEVSQPSKSSSLKRFFKVSKKPQMRDQMEEESGESSDENTKEGAKSNTLSRFLTRMKGTNKDAAEKDDPSITNSAPNFEDVEKPAPNTKPTIKASISTYWKHLFHRQRSHRHDVGSEAVNSSTAVSQQNEEEVHELKQVLNDTISESTETEELSFHNVSTDTRPKMSESKNLSAQGTQDSFEVGQMTDQCSETNQSQTPTLVNQYL
ncbi:hypothetical protein KR009_001056 [Drosophila setifemur]|nr:hypothetical protein KR009_001056 [Drosophila setifemur]